MSLLDLLTALALLALLLAVPALAVRAALRWLRRRKHPAE
jgi:hypothetical protein